jgi:hypothetical protein
VVITFDDEVYDMVQLGKFHVSLLPVLPPLLMHAADLHTRYTEQFYPSLVINRHTRDNAQDASEAALEMVQLCTQVRV